MLSLLVPPERFSAFLAAPAGGAARRPCSTGSRRCTASAARFPMAMLERAWGVDPFTLGYIASLGARAT